MARRELLCRQELLFRQDDDKEPEIKIKIKTHYLEKFEDTTGESESVNRRRTDNTMVNQWQLTTNNDRQNTT